jgi:hypothetical protein
MMANMLPVSTVVPREGGASSRQGNAIHEMKRWIARLRGR